MENEQASTQIPAEAPASVEVPTSAEPEGLDQASDLPPRCDLAEPPVVCVGPHGQQHSNREGAARVAPAQESVDSPRGSDEGRNKAAAVQDSTIRVNVTLLDRLMNLVGELVLARNQIMQYATSRMIRFSWARFNS